MVASATTMDAGVSPPVVRYLGTRPYGTTLSAMRDFTAARAEATDDEIWCLEHPPVFTLGQAGRDEHLLDPGPIPVVHVDRGGQVTYHGPGQLVVYVLLDLRRRGLGVRELVQRLEQSVIDLLADQGLAAERRPRAPGVYVGESKVSALGLRVRHGCCYHGLALNVDVDLSPFRRINPCGYAGLRVTSLRELGLDWDVAKAADALVPRLLDVLG